MSLATYYGDSALEHLLDPSFRTKMATTDYNQLIRIYQNKEAVEVSNKPIVIQQYIPESLTSILRYSSIYKKEEI